MCSGHIYTLFFRIFFYYLIQAEQIHTQCHWLKFGRKYASNLLDENSRNLRRSRKQHFYLNTSSKSEFIYKTVSTVDYKLVGYSIKYKRII